MAALVQRGETLVKLTHKYRVYTRAAGGYYYIGQRGALRFGNNIATSIPCSQKFKNDLLGA